MSSLPTRSKVVYLFECAACGEVTQQEWFLASYEVEQLRVPSTPEHPQGWIVVEHEWFCPKHEVIASLIVDGLVRHHDKFVAGVRQSA